MDYWEWPPPDSAAARIDEQEHLKRVAADLQALEPPKRTPAPELVTRQEIDARFEKIYGNILSVCQKLLARIEALEAKAQFLDED
jgi:hypothetical protein